MGLGEKLNAPECMELWTRRFEIKEVHTLSLSGSLFLEDAWTVMLQLPASPKGRDFGWILDGFWMGEESLGTT